MKYYIMLGRSFQDTRRSVFIMAKIELTEEQLTHLGYELADIRRTVEMATNMTETLAWVQLKDETAFKEMSKKFFDTFNEQFGLLHATLDEIAFILMNSTDKAEILGSKIFN